ncbi:hypothetical protein MKX08_007964 [Trichoderma sp. CBMAI-0020]|nr:hypothetical protein MKX08_007964 [Trichoderma sp. CBMAI-0020]
MEQIYEALTYYRCALKPAFDTAYVDLHDPGGILTLDEANNRDIKTLAIALHLDGKNATRLANQLLITLRNEYKASPVGESFLSKLNDVEVSQLVKCTTRGGCPVFIPLSVTLDIKTDRKALS